MNILYYLQDLVIGPESELKVGRVQTRGSLTERNLLDRMANRGTGISREDMHATLELLTQEIMDALVNGWAVNTRLANYRPGIKGTFVNATDPFDPKRHRFRAATRPGNELKKKMGEASGERITIPPPAPFPSQYIDHGSDTTDNVLTPDNIGELTGRELKYDVTNTEEGIFLVPEDGGETTKVATVSILTDSRLMFKVPSTLAAGEYTMEVRRGYTKETSIRTGTLRHTLSVA